MDRPAVKAPIWSPSPSQLATECRLIAGFDSASIDKTLREEARRLYAVWQDALEQPGENEDDHARKAVLRAGLRKRAIEILIKISGQS
jgi:hypothetical protein